MVTNPVASQASFNNEDQDTIGDDRSLLSKCRAHNPPRLLPSTNGHGLLSHSQSAHAAICLPQHGDHDSTSEESSQCGKSVVANDRGNWSKQLDFFLSCVGYAVGLGNIWRFPYLCYRSGGGAFLVPYLIFLIICGIPLFFLEMSFGQFASLGPVAIWKISPMFKGLGYGMVIISGIVCIYYNVIIAWTLYYTYQTLGYVLPWASCGNAWNTPNCIDQHDEGDNSTSSNETSSAIDLLVNVTNLNATAQIKMTSSEEFWLHYVLRISTGIENLGEIQWPLVLTLFLAWVVVFLCLMKGVKSSGKVVYFSATFPYIVLVILLIRGVTLPGAKEGIIFYLNPRWELLKSFKVWGDAATQIFYSVGASWGAVLTMASYNRFNNNCYRDSLMIPVINCATSVFAGFVVFSIIGFMAYETGKPIEEVVSQGPGLAFVVYPEAVARLPISPLWALLFFIMLFTIGLDSQFGMFEAMVSAFVDEFPILRKRKILFIAFMCVVMFLLGIPCVTQGGMYVLQLMDWYSATFSLMIISFFETVVIGWIYGADRFLHDIFLMTKKTPPFWWKLCWCYITPIAIVSLLIFIFVNHTPVTYGSYTYPDWSIVLGWMMAMCSLLPIPLVAIYEVFFKAKGSFLERLKEASRPTPEWGPHAEENRLLYRKSLSTVSSNLKQLYVAGLTNSESEISNGKLRFNTENMLSPLEDEKFRLQNESKV